MNKFLTFLFAISFCSCEAQTGTHPTIEFTTDLELFGDISNLKESLKDVEIIALGENTHGLGDVFKTKTELVKFLHQELGFDLVLFESGFGDAALAWEQIETLSAKDFTRAFTSNSFYHSTEIESLINYIKSENGTLRIQGFDCQPQQNYLIKRMMEIVQPLDSTFAKRVPLEMKSFNNLYQFENDKDTLSFNKQRDRFIDFLTNYNSLLNNNVEELVNSGITQNEINALNKSNQVFLSTYSEINLGEMMGWPISYNIRDKALLDLVKWFKETNPTSKIIIWAQNSHIENKEKSNNKVKWMGHSLKKDFGEKYYSIGAIVYSGKNLNYNGTFDFEHKDSAYLAYHLNKFQKEAYVLDLRNYPKVDFTSDLLLGMESNGNTAEFIAKDRFDGILFLRYSDVPSLVKEE